MGEQVDADKYRLLFDNMLNGFAYHRIVLDESGRPIDYVFLEINDAFERLTGLRRENILGRKVTEALPGIEKDHTDWIGRYGKVALTGEEARFKSYSEVLNRWYSVIAYRPEAEHFAVVFESITERRKAEARVSHLNAVLRGVRNVNQLITRRPEREELLAGACRGLVEARGYPAVWLVLLDEGRRFVTAAEAGLGRYFEPIRERLVQGELPECCEKALDDSGVVAIDDPASGCPRCAMERGRRGSAALAVRLEYGARVYGVMIIEVPAGIAAGPEEKSLLREAAGDIAFALRGLDIDEARKRAEEELRTSRRALESSINAIALADLEGKLTYINPSFLKMWGFERREEAIGRPATDFWEAEEKAREIMAALGRQGTWMGELTAKKKDGALFDVELCGSMVADDAGRPVCMMASFVDVSARKAAEKALRETEEQFRQSQKLEAVGRLAGGVAHDFNNMLGAIIGYSDLILPGLEERDPLWSDISHIKDAAVRAAGLTRQLLAFSRKQTLEPRVLGLNDVVVNLERMLRRLIGEDIEFRTVLAEELGRVKADPGQVEQVIMNLAVNARDAMPEGGKLTIETANVELDEDYTRNHMSVTPGPHVMLAMSDTGCGMDSDTRSQIFEPFFTTKEVGKVTGLGLSTVYGIVKQSGGSIWVYSEPGKGTTFKIYFPLVEEAIEPEKAKKPSDRRSRGQETVLVVEDEEVLRGLVKRMLGLLNYRALEAASGGEALLLCERHTEPIHLMITDMVMPQMGGRQLAERVASLHPEMKVLYMSGYTDNAIVHHGVLDPGTPFLQKPFTASSLAHAVREVLDAPDEQRAPGQGEEDPE